MFNYDVKNCLKWIFILSLTLLFVSCGPAHTSEITAVDYENVNSSIPNTDSYPLPSTIVSSQSAYPSNGDAVTVVLDSTVEPYPPPVETDQPFKEPRFRIDSPLSANDTVVTGQALPNLHLAIVDITYNGIVLGTGQSDTSGQFSISVTGLSEGHRVGITIAELPAGQTFNEAVLELYPHRGIGFMNIPNVGVFFDTILIES